MKKKIFIKGALTEKRALKQLEGALKCKTQQRLKIDNRNSNIGWETILVKRMRKIFLNPMWSSSNVWTLLSRLEKEIQRALSNYEQNLTSVLAQFPAQKINNAILDYLSKIDPRERDIVELTLEPIVELCSRYRGGNFRFLPISITLLHKWCLSFGNTCYFGGIFFNPNSVFWLFWSNFGPNIGFL